MRSQITATRNTCFAIISAIETDLRAHITDRCAVAGVSDILPPDVRETATRRWHADHNSSATFHPESDFELVDYTDFADLAKVLHRTLKNTAADGSSTITEIASALERVAPVRNRVCHSRPLEPEDLPTCVDLSSTFTRTPQVDFHETRRIRSLLDRDPSFVLGIQIPDFWQVDQSGIHQNLPLPEFDETGFLGRRKDRRDLHKLLRSHYPVVTVVGEGGVGKTALALRCLYDILEEEDPPYDAIVWTTLKVTALTAGGVIQLNNDVATTLGLLRSAADTLGTPSVRELSTSALIDEITEYMAEYRILFAVDNLETVATGELRELLLKIPPRSKLLITSRVGIGELEARYALSSLDMPTALVLMRRFASVLGVHAMQSAPDAALRHYANALFLNPLLLKWFIASVARGADPSALVVHSEHGFKAALDFCLTNVFESLTATESRLVDTLVVARQPLTAAEFSFLNAAVEQAEIERALGSLHNSSIVVRSFSADGAFTYQMSESALVYARSHQGPTREEARSIRGQLAELRKVTEREGIKQTTYHYEIFSVRARTRDERIAAVLLRHALDHRKSDIMYARDKIGEAKQLLPAFSEVYRVAGLVEIEAGQEHEALTEFDRAVDCDPTSTIARYTYAQTLMRSLGDYATALEQLNVAEEHDRTGVPIRTAKALALTRLGRVEEAAAIYEELIRDNERQPRRWRISTRDQAAEVYRRWARVDIRNRDYENFVEHISKAIEHLREAVDRNQFDDKTVERLGRVLTEGVRGASAMEDFDVAEGFVRDIEIVAARLPQRTVHIGNRDRSYVERALAGRQDLTDRVLALCWGNSQARTPKRNETAFDGGVEVGSSEFGWIYALPRGTRFGFIRDEKERSWFFHYGDVVGQTRIDNMRVGTAVEFVVGENERGRCARKVAIK